MKILDAKPFKPIVIKTPPSASPFQKSRFLQERYARALRAVAREVGKLIKGYAPKDVISADKLKRALRQYAEILEPWALHLTGGILQSVNNQDFIAWRQHSMKMSEVMRKEILSSDVGKNMKELMDQNVKLIQSIPLEAAQRIHDLVTGNIAESARADEIAKKIMETEGITKNRATLIARTEIARASSTLTQARATNIGSTGYFWRTSRDLLVRKSHKEMEGKFVKWDDPPMLDNMKAHAGGFPNCRCYPEPEIPEKL